HLIIQGYYKGLLPDEIGELSALRTLVIRDTNAYQEGGSNIVIPAAVWKLTELRELRLGPGFPYLIKEGQQVDDLRGAEAVKLKHVEVFELLYPLDGVPDQFWDNPNLREVTLTTNHETLPSLAGLPLTSLTLTASNLKDVPDLPPTLTFLRLRANNVTVLPSLAHTQLKQLELEIGAIERLPATPSSLHTLRIYGMRKGEAFVDIPPVTELYLGSCYKLKTIREFPSTLKRLRIAYCSELDALPPLPPLDLLEVSKCGVLTRLPDGLMVDRLMLNVCKNLRELPSDIVIGSFIEVGDMPDLVLPDFPPNVRVEIRDDDLYF
ncbi:MAG: hypothetical protein AAF125_16760, partial [Chloroflexota bacterium]